MLAKLVNRRWNTRDPIMKWKAGLDRPGDDDRIRRAIQKGSHQSYVVFPAIPAIPANFCLDSCNAGRATTIVAYEIGFAIRPKNGQDLTDETGPFVWG